jgi:anti-sigma factor RsiW
MESSDQENLIVRYLLGELPEADADALEVRLLSEPDLAEEMQSVEYELIDRYVRNQMHETERKRFESHYLSTPLHRERLATARGLLQAADEFTLAMPARETYATVASERTSWWRAMFATPALAWSTGVAIALLGAIIIWLLFERGRLQQQLQAQQLRTQSLESELAQLRQTTEQLGEQLLARANLTPGATAKIEIKDGEQLLALDAQGQLRGAESYSASEKNWLQQTLQAERLLPEVPAWIDLRVPRDALMGGGTENSFALQQPLSQALLTTTPTLRWQALPEAESYRVEIYDMNSQRVAASEALPQTSWQVRPALPAGKVYQWQVIATRQGEEIQSPVPPAPPARFAVIAASEIAAITQARKRQPVPHLLLATLYARNALYAEAESELLALQKANPDSAQVKQMIADVRRRSRQSKLGR